MELSKLFSVLGMVLVYAPIVFVINFFVFNVVFYTQLIDILKVSFVVTVLGMDLLIFAGIVRDYL